jgi:hypothetical protein
MPGSLSGVVQDPSEAVLPGITVSVSRGGGYTATVISDDLGRFVFAGLLEGSYLLSAELEGFQRFEEVIVIDSGTIKFKRIQLILAELEEEVEVVAQDDLDPFSYFGSHLTDEEIENMPFGVRNFVEAGEMMSGGFDDGAEPNLEIDGVSTGSTFEGATGQSSGGGRRVTIEAVKGFAVKNRNYSAEHSNLGSNVFDIALKSGTNRYHGAVYDFHRNSALGARNFFDRSKAALVSHSFGGNIGGPIVKRRVFFFASYEGLREREGFSRVGRVPTIEERSGDFSGSPKDVIDPLNKKKPFPNNVVPLDRFDPVSVGLLEFYPLPNRPGYNNYLAHGEERDQMNDLVVKGDLIISRRDHASVHWISNQRDRYYPFSGSILPGFGSDTMTHVQTVGLVHNRILSRSVFNQLQFSYSRYSVFGRSVNWQTDYAKLLGIPGLTEDPSLLGFPAIDVRGYEDLGDSTRYPIDFTANDYRVSEMVSFNRGKHNFRFGGELIRSQLFELVADRSRGSFRFQGRWTSKSKQSAKQESFADFLLGYLNSTQRRLSQDKSYLFSTVMGFYLQDDWKIRRDLTLNFGIRYDLLLPPYDKYNHWSNFIPELEEVVVSGTSGFPRSLIETDWNNFAPRLGLAWRPRSGMVVRSGYGLYYGINLEDPLQNRLGVNPPFALVQSFSRTKIPTGLTFTRPFPEGQGSLRGINSPSAVEFDPATGSLHQFSVSMEQLLTRQLVMEAVYMGSKGTHLGRSFDINQPFRDPDALVQKRPFPEFASIRYFGFDSDSSYNALRLRLSNRGSKRVTLRSTYTFGRMIDEGSRLTEKGSAGFGTVQNTRNRDAEHSLSSYDRRHSLVASALIRLPEKLEAAWQQALLQGWQASAMCRWYSGRPFTPIIQNRDPNRGEGNRPDRVGSGQLSEPNPEMWFKVDDFIPLPVGAERYGNSGRNIIQGPVYFSLDSALIRSFILPNEHRLQFRFEVFNISNTVNFYTPETRIDLPTAGAVNRASSARRMRGSLKYYF